MHYVWCAEAFDGTKLAGYSGASTIAPTSNPADIYKTVRAECERGDRHSAKISEWKLNLTALAVRWQQEGKITDQQKQDIVYLVENAPFSQWRPLVYIISRPLVEARMEAVPAAQCASFGPEYIVRDLARHEFDVIEL